ncbi:MAG: glycosyltransferase [Nitrospirales bacterium]|nr:glycosyltransferase [Nitrospirales bacterium]
MAAEPPKLSAVIIAFNDEPNMRACLESVCWADEIIVVDSFSTDATEKISREFTDRVYQEKFSGFGALRNAAMQYASYDWILSVDTDERVTSDARTEIQTLLQHGPEANAYFVPRRNVFLGQWIRHCGWYPDYRQPQLFRKQAMRYREDLVHEGFDVDGTLGYLKNAIEQYPFRDLDHFFQKMNRYSSLMANRLDQEGRRFHPHQLFTHTGFTFLKMYGLRLGCLDGAVGFILSILYAYYTFLKYAKLWELQKSHATITNSPH